MKPPDTPCTLLRNLADPEAKEAQWSRFVSLYEPLIRAWLALRGLAGDALEESTQDVLVRLVRALRNSPFDAARARFRTYLGCIVDCVARDRFRHDAAERRHRADLDAHAIDALTDPAPAVDERLDLQLRLAAYEVALGVIRRDPALNDLQRAVFDACILGEERPVDLARRLGCLANTAVQTRRRLLARVRAHAEALVEGSQSPEA